MFVYFLKKLDWTLIISVFLLTAIGLLSIFSTSFYRDKTFFYKQAAFIIVGFFLVLAFAFLDYRFFRNHPTFLLALYFLSVLLLVVVLFFGKIRGAASWFNLGFFNFEPVEFAKLVMILIFAQYFSLRHIELYRIIHIIISGAYTVLVVGLVFLQPDLGSAAVLIFLWLGVMIVAGIKLRHILLLFLIGAILFAIAWFAVLKPYQKGRVSSFLNPYLDPKGSGYHRIQALIAIGSGQLLGRGLGQGPQSQLNFLPEQHTDFIFASIAEEWGFVGLMIIFICYFLLLFRIIKIAINGENNFARLFCVGAAIVFIFHISVNIGMNLGLLPIAGISLPFVSYGGSNLLINFII
ncbi:MAG: rod shape-determining protein RodA, partial [Candidatus Berkelbacteria bacterium]|nr:rod shape-determining protein RodA [Candidatus Berkelbacteria bacterium]